MKKPTAVAGQRLLAFLIDALLICLVDRGRLAAPGGQAAEGAGDRSGGFDIGDKRYALHRGEPRASETLRGSSSRSPPSSSSRSSSRGSRAASPGRALAGIRVVERARASAPGVRQAVVRWLLWIVDGFVLLGRRRHPACSPRSKNQRVGDMVAKTYTVAKDARRAAARSAARRQAQPGVQGGAATGYQRAGGPAAARAGIRTRTARPGCATGTARSGPSTPRSSLCDIRHASVGHVRYLPGSELST